MQTQNRQPVLVCTPSKLRETAINPPGWVFTVREDAHVSQLAQKRSPPPVAPLNCKSFMKQRPAGFWSAPLLLLIAAAAALPQLAATQSIYSPGLSQEQVRSISCAPASRAVWSGTGSI